MTDPIEQLFETIIETIQSDAQASEELATAVCNAIVAKSELVEVLKTDRRMVQINQGNASGYQVLVEDGIAYIGTHYQIDGNTLKSLLEVVLRRVFQPSVGIPQNLPHRGAPKFVGRDRELATLHEQLQQNDRLAIASVQGMGGVGKTELALQYGLKHLPLGTYPGGVCWLRSREDVGSQIVEFARRQLSLEPPEELELIGRVEYCWRHWRAGDVLAIFDDVQNYEDIQPYFPPVESRFKVLMTTRSRMGASVRELELQVLSKDAALDLLREIVGIDRIESQFVDAEALCEWLGYLPLGLELVGRYLARKRDLSLAGMRKRLEQKLLEQPALEKTQAGMTAKLGVAAAFELSWQELDEQGQQLAGLLGLFAAAPIPWRLVQDCLPDRDREELEDVRDEQLLGLNLIQRVSDGLYQLHSLIREFFEAKLFESQEAERLGKALANVLIETSQLITSRLTQDDTSILENTIAHLELFIQKFNRYIKDEDCVCIPTSLAQYAESQSNWKDAKIWSEYCLALTENRCGSDHISTAISLNNLSIIYGDIGEIENEEALMQRFISIFRKHLGEDHFSIALRLRNLAGIKIKSEKADESESLLYQSLAIQEKNIIESKFDYATTLVAIACIKMGRGDFEGAKKIILQAMNFQKILIKEDPQNTNSILQLAKIFSMLSLINAVMGEFNEEEINITRSFKIHRKLLNRNNPELLNSLISLAEFHTRKGNFNKAEILYEDVMNIYVISNNILSIAKIHHKFYRLYVEMGKYLEAIHHLKETFSIYKNVYGEFHVNISNLLSDFGHVYRRQGKYLDAEQAYLRSLNIASKTLEKNDLSIAQKLSDLGEVYKLKHDFANAELSLVRCISIIRNISNDYHPLLAKPLSHLASVSKQLGKWAEAENLYIQALEISTLYKIEPALHTNNLAIFYLGIKQFKKAEPLCIQALHLYEKHLGIDHPYVGISLVNLATIRIQEDHCKAETYILRSLKILENSVGETHVWTVNSLNYLSKLRILQGRYDEAESTCLRTLNILDILSDIDPLSMVGVWNNFGRIYYLTQKYEKSHHFYNKALSLSESINDKSEGTSKLIQNILDLHNEQNNYDEMETLYLKLIALQSDRLGKDHLDTQTTQQSFTDFIDRLIQLKQVSILSNHPLTQKILQQRQ